MSSQTHPPKMHHQITQATTVIKPCYPPLILSTRKSQPQTHFICAKWGKRRSSSPRRSHKLLLASIASLASHLNILPEPFDSLARQFFFLSSAGGNGNGKFWLSKGFGGGGGEGRNRKLGFWFPLMLSSALALWVVIDIDRQRGSHNDWVLLLLVSAFAVYCMLRGCRRDWLLGFSCGAAFMGLGLRNHQDLGKWLVKFRAGYPNLLSTSKRTRKARRWL